jgi:hypothetical protein
MPHPFVRSATIKDDSIEITVEFDPPDVGTYAEVSGTASQTGGAFANFYDIKEVIRDPAEQSGLPPIIAVSAHPLPPNKFRKNEDVTFVIRVAKIWLTVLGPQGAQKPATTDPGVPADRGTTWNVKKAESHVQDDDDAGDSPDGAGGVQTSAAGSQ